MTNSKNIRIVIIDSLETAGQRDGPASQWAACGTAAGTGLLESGCSIVAVLRPDANLDEQIGQLAPDVIIVEEHSDSALKSLVEAATRFRLPIVCFAEDDDRARMHAAIEGGVAGYIVTGLSPEQVRLVLDLAIARFDFEQKLRDELCETKRRLAERKIIDRAKGLVMARHHCTEEEAYRKLRRQAMDKNLKLAELAQSMLDTADLLG